MTDSPQPLLDVRDLVVEYPKERAWGRPHRVIDGVSLTIGPGEILGLVGESGSGKSTIGRAILGLAPVTAGTIRFAGDDITHLTPKQRRRRSSDIQVVFQNPYGSLNPSLTVGSILSEPLRARSGFSRQQSDDIVSSLLQRVGLPADAAQRYPSHFSGGQRQRIAIARALAIQPKLVVCDEPTSALDVSTQASVLDLLSELRAQSGVSYLFITHDLAVVRRFADRVAVLDQGRIVESGTAADVCEHPKDAYTRALVAAAPVPDPVVQRQRRQHRAAAGSVEADHGMATATVRTESTGWV